MRKPGILFICTGWRRPDALRIANTCQSSEHVVKQSIFAASSSHQAVVWLHAWRTYRRQSSYRCAVRWAISHQPSSCGAVPVHWNEKTDMISLKNRHDEDVDQRRAACVTNKRGSIRNSVVNNVRFRAILHFLPMAWHWLKPPNSGAQEFDS